MRTLGVLFAVGLVGTAAAALREASPQHPVPSSHPAPPLEAEPPLAAHDQLRFPAGPVPFGGVRGDPPSAPGTPGRAAPPSTPARRLIIDAERPVSVDEPEDCDDCDRGRFEPLGDESDEEANVDERVDVERVVEEDGLIIYRLRDGVTIAGTVY